MAYRDDEIAEVCAAIDRAMDDIYQAADPLTRLAIRLIEAWIRFKNWVVA